MMLQATISLHYCLSCLAQAVVVLIHHAVYALHQKPPPHNRTGEREPRGDEEGEEEASHQEEEEISVGFSSRRSSRERYDPEDCFQRLFQEDGSFDLAILEKVTSGRSIAEVCGWYDVDHYNLLEKAVIYNNRTVVRLILSLEEPSCEESTHKFLTTFEQSLEPFRCAIHLAAFLGCVDIVLEFLDYNPTLSVLRGPVYVRPVAGPANDLFRIIGYGEFNNNPRLTFQMKWLRSHPNERPVHYAICGGYPMIMRMLQSASDQNIPFGDDSVDFMDIELNEEASQYVSDAANEKDCLLAHLIRQAAACASYGCLHSLLQDAPEAMYLRDGRGWLYIASGLPHGTQFIKFLLEQGFAVKLLNNINGKGTFNALHLFYHNLSKSDGITAKFSEVYDVTDLLLDLGVDPNLETDVYRSHGLKDTPLHILIDNLNMDVLEVTEECNLSLASRLPEDTQQVYDESVRDAVCLLLESDYQLDRYCHTILQRLFSNRNFLCRYKRSNLHQNLRQANYGLRNVYSIAKFLLSGSGITLRPSRREVTSTLSLIDTLADEHGVACVLGDRRATQIFTACLNLLFRNGDNPNIYPFTSAEDSYLASPLVQLCDSYIGQWCGRKIAHLQTHTLVNWMEVLETLCDAGAGFTCYMTINGTYYKHGVFDCLRRLFTIIYRDLRGKEDQAINMTRLDVAKTLLSCLLQYSADPAIHEFIFRQAQLPVTQSHMDDTVLGQFLLLGFNLATVEAEETTILLQSMEFRSCRSLLLNSADHQSFYSCLSEVLHVAGEMKDLTTECKQMYEETRYLSAEVRSLQVLARLVIRRNIGRCNVSRVLPRLPLPGRLREFVCSYEL